MILGIREEEGERDIYQDSVSMTRQVGCNATGYGDTSTRADI